MIYFGHIEDKVIKILFSACLVSILNAYFFYIKILKIKSFIYL